MPQSSDTGRHGFENGCNMADEIGALLGAARLTNSNNKFRRGDRTVVKKTGPSAVIIRAMLGRVAAIVCGDETDAGWVL